MTSLLRFELIRCCSVVCRLRIQTDKGQYLGVTWFAIFSDVLLSKLLHILPLRIYQDIVVLIEVACRLQLHKGHPTPLLEVVTH